MKRLILAMTLISSFSVIAADFKPGDSVQINQSKVKGTIVGIHDEYVEFMPAGQSFGVPYRMDPSMLTLKKR